MEKLLLITPPFVQVNCPYPATAYLKGYLTRHGHQVEQYDLSIELINRLFTVNCCNGFSITVLLRQSMAIPIWNGSTLCETII